jgi:uncharacterized protein (TIGR02600 family)
LAKLPYYKFRHAWRKARQRDWIEVCIYKVIQKYPPQPSFPRSSGTALVLVLTALALIGFMALAILTFIRSEDRASRVVADFSALQTLQGVPEKMVISQIRRATTDLGRYGGSTWTSQPGMIRVFGTEMNGNGVDRAPVEQEFFKLYSSDRMSQTGAYDPTLDVPSTDATWRDQPGLWTNINQPMAVTPVRQPGGAAGPPQARLVYPIFHPGTAQVAVPGFEVVQQGGQQNQNAQVADPSMPVRWIYVLADGQLAPAQARGDGVVTVAGASRTNSIVGRVAFWTDDESCKLNVNVASEAAPWTRPVTTSREDLNQARTIPTKGEYYRDAAHPASISLSPVLQRFGRLQGATPNVEPAVREPRDRVGGEGRDWFENSVRPIHDMLPQTPYWLASAQWGGFGGSNITTSEVALKRQRWFTSSDEMFFAPSPGAGQIRPKNVPGSLAGSTGLAAFSQLDLEWARFFLTTRSRAPETNPFGGPKISLWPVQAAASERHELDRKMVLATSLPAATTNTRNEYYFQRVQSWVAVTNPGSSQSALEDMNLPRNQTLMSYLESMTERIMPGAGGSFAEKYGLASRNQLLVSMFDFLRWGVNPISPYDQQLRDPYQVNYSAVAPSIGMSNPDGIGSFSAVPSQKQVLAGEGGALREDVTQPPIWVVKGLGRFPTIGEVSLVLVAVAVEKTGTAPKNSDGEPDWADRTLSVQAFVVVEPYLVSAGSTPVNADYRLRIRGLDTLAITGPGGSASLGFQPDVVTRLSCSAGRAGLTGDHAAYSSMASQFITNIGAPRTWAVPLTDEDTQFGLAGAVVDISGIVTATSSVGQVLGVSQATLTVGIYDTPSAMLTDSGALVQQMEVPFPAVPVPPGIPVPLLKLTDLAKTLDAAGDPLTDVERFNNRFTPVLAGGVNRIPFLHRGDVVVSIEATVQPSQGGAGDMRLLAASPEVPPRDSAGALLANGMMAPFRLVPTAPAASAPVGAGIDWAFQNHTLRDGAYMMEGQPGMKGTDDPIPTALTAGGLIGRSAPGTPPIVTPLLYDPRAAPAAPIGTDVRNFDNRPGDFDNGPGILEDGPYINIPEFTNGVNEAGTLSGASAGLFQRGGVFYEDSGVTFSPWRQMGSAIGFGSLPSGIYGVGGVGGAVAAGTDLQPRPWQTLLFCANPPSRTTPPPALGAYDPSPTGTAKDHFGFREPRDHWWLEYFWMPAVEPGGLVDGYATEGKVNMNFQILPFKQIRRSTAMHGALNGVRMTAIPSKSVSALTAGNNHYKRPEGSEADFLYAVNAAATLEQFQQRFDQNRVFVSPSEICDLMLVPEALPGRQYDNNRALPTSAAQVIDWWEGAVAADPNDGMEATGDNTREAPYGQLYPKLCTRSNIFKVHYRVQALQKASSTDPKLWVDGKDRIAGEYRGEAIIERYIDPNRVNFVDFATNPNTPLTLDDYCDYRVIGRKQFAP